jgi:phospholipid/cholesterol/gamma-HCH transport system permease protein
LVAVSAVNPAAIVNQIDRMGVGAIPVVVLMSGIVGAIVAQQGAFQLRYFGADIFVVDLVGILILREIGVLMTAIMIAGPLRQRDHCRDRLDEDARGGRRAHRHRPQPVGVLVFPRLVALVIACRA